MHIMLSRAASLRASAYLGTLLTLSIILTGRCGSLAVSEESVSVHDLMLNGNRVVENAPGTGKWGGKCTCPGTAYAFEPQILAALTVPLTDRANFDPPYVLDGATYQVADNNDAGSSLACVGGIRGAIDRHYYGEWSHRRVHCAATMVPAPSPMKTGDLSSPKAEPSHAAHSHCASVPQHAWQIFVVGALAGCLVTLLAMSNVGRRQCCPFSWKSVTSTSAGTDSSPSAPHRKGQLVSCESHTRSSACEEHQMRCATSSRAVPNGRGAIYREPGSQQPTPRGRCDTVTEPSTPNTFVRFAGHGEPQSFPQQPSEQFAQELWQAQPPVNRLASSAAVAEMAMERPMERPMEREGESNGAVHYGAPYFRPAPPTSTPPAPPTAPPISKRVSLSTAQTSHRAVAREGIAPSQPFSAQWLQEGGWQPLPPTSLPQVDLIGRRAHSMGAVASAGQALQQASAGARAHRVAHVDGASSTLTPTLKRGHAVGSHETWGHETWGQAVVGAPGQDGGIIIHTTTRSGIHIMQGPMVGGLSPGLQTLIYSPATEEMRYERTATDEAPRFRLRVLGMPLSRWDMIASCQSVPIDWQEQIDRVLRAAQGLGHEASQPSGSLEEPSPSVLPRPRGQELLHKKPWH